MEKDNVGRRCVICAAGPVWNVDSLRSLLREDDWLVAADGGVRLAERLDITPDMIVADFDSASREQVELMGVPIAALPVKKDDTDTMAAAKIALDKGFRSFLLIGATGARLDHTLANCAVLLYLANRGAKAVLADENNRLEMALPGHYVVESVENAHLSLLPYAGCVSGLTVKNVEYELENATLSPEIPLGVSNEFIGRSVEISFREGILMIFVSKD